MRPLILCALLLLAGCGDDPASNESATKDCVTLMQLRLDIQESIDATDPSDTEELAFWTKQAQKTDDAAEQLDC
jgi:uncharacterized lipoprotein YajG